MPTLGEGAIGSLDYNSEERKSLAKKFLITNKYITFFFIYNLICFFIFQRSQSFYCSVCQVKNESVLPNLTEKSQEITAEAKELASQIQFKNSQNNNNNNNNNSSNDILNVSQSESFIQQNQNESEIVHRRPPTIAAAHVETTTENLTRSNISRSLAGSSHSSNFDNKMLLIYILGALFLILLCRRIYIVLNSTP